MYPSQKFSIIFSSSNAKMCNDRWEWNPFWMKSIKRWRDHTITIAKYKTNNDTIEHRCYCNIAIATSCYHFLTIESSHYHFIVHSHHSHRIVALSHCHNIILNLGTIFSQFFLLARFWVSLSPTIKLSNTCLTVLILP